MANGVDPVFGVNLRDLMSDNGVVFNYGNEIDENDDDRFKFDPHANFTDDELLKFINLEISDDEQDEDDDDDDDAGDDRDNDDSKKCKATLLPGLNFDKIKEKISNLCDDGKIKKLILQRGVGNIIPENSLVTVKYSGYLEGQDSPFDSTYHRNSVSYFRLSDAYGEIGCWPTIPGNSEVMFIVQLIDYNDNSEIDDFNLLDPGNRKVFLKIEKSIKQLLITGANNYQRGQVKFAINDYKRAIDRLENSHLDNDEEEKRYNCLLSRAYQNLAVCYNKENKLRKACIACNNVTNKTAKTYFHFGRALIKMGEFQEAIAKLNLGLKIDPHNKEMTKELDLADKLQRWNLIIQQNIQSSCSNMAKLSSDAKNKEYRKIASELCDNFINNNNIMRGPFPNEIDPMLRDIIRKIALLKGIKVTSIEKDGEINFYLEKSNYQ
ncbi:inactive peptidyl-prolyl cis-trans isomerase FKBP6-like isoform X2 [Cotesia typhae]|uniref:inactive peptidyl-prolyl cis-trans isomerase FKBP6-like isoform X2 n=1 Tax=Cotesia typhae TaxID=2053667 RepID=UPI003D681CAE